MINRFANRKRYRSSLCPRQNCLHLGQAGRAAGPTPKVYCFRWRTRRRSVKCRERNCRQGHLPLDSKGEWSPTQSLNNRPGIYRTIADSNLYGVSLANVHTARARCVACFCFSSPSFLWFFFFFFWHRFFHGGNLFFNPRVCTCVNQFFAIYIDNLRVRVRTFRLGSGRKNPRSWDEQANPKDTGNFRISLVNSRNDSLSPR